MRIVDSAGNRYWLSVESLEDVCVGTLMESFCAAGYPVSDVRKVVHEGRGRVLIEFSGDVDLFEAKKAIDNGKSAGDIPVQGHHYRLKGQMVLRTTYDTPITLPQNTVLKHAGDTMTQSQFWVQNGKHKDVTVRMSGAEWHLHSGQLIDLGDDLSLGKGSGKPKVPNKLEPVTKGGAGAQGPAPGLKPPKQKKPKKKGFPPFPKRTPLSAYMGSKK